MKTLRSISTAVLLCLILAAPAAADELSLSTPSVFSGETVSYTIKVEEHPGTSFIAMVRLTNDPTCLLEKSTKQNILSTASFTKPTTETRLLTGLYEAFGTYQVCEYFLNENEKENAKPQIIKTFEVVAHPVPPTPTVPVAPVSTPAPVTAIPSAIVPHVTVLTAAQKLRAALKKCKHQKNKRKRVKCERAAKKVRH
jgi:hypothetical protein